MDEMVKLLREMIENKELWAIAAQFVKCNVDALMEAGFTREEAMQFISRQGSMVKGGN